VGADETPSNPWIRFTRDMPFIAEFVADEIAYSPKQALIERVRGSRLADYLYPSLIFPTTWSSYLAPVSLKHILI
jgi:hypothetical protein